ncbi:MAG: transcriptional repressor [Thermodesulfobacteria bacterium]|nr:transcriptional repressor [Thermodesulfobacteriota bacterium]
MVNVSEVVENFREFIKSKGLKYTPEREEILREILECKEHFDVDELYIKLKKRGSKVSKASIYRTIPLLIEAGYVQEVYKQNNRAYYEVVLNKMPHIHFICLNCKNVEEIEDERLVTLIKEYADQKGFTLLSYHLEVFGVCNNCRNEE